ncbi:FecR domain-containing protein [Segatella baroniae]|uniref:FecR domain-containing protein n=1 Tax=Segatella baroniae TaxID=305719 RepID=UPI000471C005|nr:FecR domain-containing protein [Segatella baroniae]
MEIKEIQQLVQAYFDGIFPPEGRSLLKRWLILPTDAERKDHALKAVWNNAEPDATDVEAALETFRNNRRSYERQRQRRHRTALLLRRAAVLALPLLAAAAAWKLSADYHAQPRLAEFHVGEGRIDSLTLADGSKIIVNAASTLLYPATFNPHTGRRDVFLTGEAHFEVAKDERHPSSSTRATSTYGCWEPTSTCVHTPTTATSSPRSKRAASGSPTTAGPPS